VIDDIQTSNAASCVKQVGELKGGRACFQNVSDGGPSARSRVCGETAPGSYRFYRFDTHVLRGNNVEIGCLCGIQRCRRRFRHSVNVCSFGEDLRPWSSANVLMGWTPPNGIDVPKWGCYRTT